MAESMVDPDPSTFGWDPGVLARQSGRGYGVSLKFGPKPQSPDDAAKRETPQWQAAWKAQRAWIQNQLFAGATLADMGFADQHGLGEQEYMALRRGDFGGFRQGWFNASKGFGRAFYAPNRDGYTMAGGGGSRLPATDPTTAAPPGFRPSAAPAPGGASASAPFGSPAFGGGGGTGASGDYDISQQLGPNMRRRRQISLGSLVG